MKMQRFLALLGAVSCLIACDRPMDTGPAYQNVVVILSDDHSSRTVGSYGNRVIRTPNIDRIAAEGMRFSRAYCNAPICSASRQNLLTGRYPHATGVNLLFTPFNDDMNYTVAEHCREHGIATAMIGKTHWNDWIYSAYWEEWPDFGFDTIISSNQWRQQQAQNPPNPLPADLPTRANIPHEKDDIRWLKNAQVLPQPYRDADASGTFLARSAIRFMEEKQDERFFIWLAFHEPHAPFAFPVEYAGKYDPAHMPLPGGSTQDQRWVPEIFRDLTEEERRGIIAAYYTSVEYMDKNVGLVLDALEEKGLKENTLVVYLSDHGYLLNEHSRFEKHTMWEEAIRAPMLFSGKGIAPGQESGELVEFVDLAPTLYEALGLPMTGELQGHSLMPMLGGSPEAVRDYAFTEYLEDNLAMVATRQWKYVFTTGRRDLSLGYATGKGPSGVVHMLYDLENDPQETSNLAYDSGQVERLRAMQDLMLKRFLETHPMAAHVPSGLNTVGKLIWFCEPGDIGDETGVMLERIFEKENIYE